MYLLVKDDSIMVDRGFLIEEICDKNQWKLIRPPFLEQKEQFTVEEAILTSKISSARVHVERSNQRIRNFEILKHRLPVNLVPYAKHIMNVICGTVNLSSPILKDDKLI